MWQYHWETVGGSDEQRSSRFKKEQQSTARKAKFGKCRNILRKMVQNYKHLSPHEDTGTHNCYSKAGQISDGN